MQSMAELKDWTLDDLDLACLYLDAIEEVAYLEGLKRNRKG